MKEVVAPHLRDGFGLHLQPVIVATKRLHTGIKYRGGLRSYAQLDGDISRLLRSTHFEVVTTFVDYYALPDDVPGMATRPPGGFRERSAYVERAWQAQVGDSRFVPYLALHEFEALLFAEPQALGCFDPVVRTSMQQILATFPDPESINERRETSPSHRLTQLMPGYQKPLWGNVAALDIGLPTLSQKCRHFGGWLSMLEAVANGSAPFLVTP